MSTAQLNKKVKNISIPVTSKGSPDAAKFNLKEYADKNIVLYFYPRDATPGCITEGQDFRDAKAKFTRQDCVVFGVSKDTIASHQKFIAKQKFNFELISDEDEKLCQYFDVIKEKNMYGKKYMGIERSTFLIGKDGKLKQEWRKVKVKEHVNEVLEAVKTLNKSTK